MEQREQSQMFLNYAESRQRKTTLGDDMRRLRSEEEQEATDTIKRRTKQMRNKKLLLCFASKKNVFYSRDSNPQSAIEWHWNGVAFQLFIYRTSTCQIIFILYIN